MHIMVVDDHAQILDVVRRYLERDGYRVTTATNGLTALAMIQGDPPDLLVLDLMLPGMDGIELCRRVRAFSNLPIVMLTARGDEGDKLAGLGTGADDYITKPFSPAELVARVKAVLRRTAAPPTQTSLRRAGEMQIDARTRSVRIADRAIDLTAREFDLLWFLINHPEQVFTREQLLDQVWDYSFEGDTSTVTVHVRRLREKIEDDPVRPRHLKTVWGVGYKFVP